MTYKEAYGDWAGNPKGWKADLTKCCVEVYPNERGMIPHQCRRARGFGPEQAYCKQHDPAAVAARSKAADEKYRAQTNKERYKWSGRHFYDTLKAIADGHNDARGLAQEVIAKFHAGER